MTDEKLGSLFEAFANYYWSIPIVRVIDTIAEWHTELKAKQVERVLNKCNEDLFWHHCCVLDEDLEEPELVTEHLIVVCEDDFNEFLAARIDAPFCECTESDLLNISSGIIDTPEAKAIIDFGKSTLGLDDEWARQLVDDCLLNQPYALCNNSSWVMEVLMSESLGRIHFRTLEQVRQFRDLGNIFYQTIPNPVLRGWKPGDIENAPVLKDDIPESDEDIPDDRAEINKLVSLYFKKKKIGRNEPCPCGSGLKFKKCTCQQFHPIDNDL